LFRHGSLVAKIYKPSKVDLQTPHSQDEVYVIISGSGNFAIGGTRQPFKAREFLFAPAALSIASRTSPRIFRRGWFFMDLRAAR
jgi:hypothetical protein